jgi:riboflavin synthase
MFTGIIESLGHIKSIKHEGTNTHFTIESPISKELKIDQSVAHNGACLTVVASDSHAHTVTAIKETLDRTNLGDWKLGTSVNLERAMAGHARLDGHIVQGHVDMTGVCTSVKNMDGSWEYTFSYQPSKEYILVDKGSVCVNGVSLTVVNPIEQFFTVCIIPYTYEHTTFKNINIGSPVNLEFDIIGKYIARYAALYGSKL